MGTAVYRAQREAQGRTCPWPLTRWARPGPLQHQGFLSHGRQSGISQWLWTDLDRGMDVSFEELIPMTSQRRPQRKERGWRGVREEAEAPAPSRTSRGRQEGHVKTSFHTSVLLFW